MNVLTTGGNVAIYAVIAQGMVAGCRNYKKPLEDDEDYVKQTKEQPKTFKISFSLIKRSSWKFF